MSKNRTRPRVLPRLSKLEIISRNEALNDAACGGCSFRLPGLLVHSFFYYKYETDRKSGYAPHSHLHWEISRITAGKAAYRIAGCPGWQVPQRHQYLVIPPGVMHEWRGERSPMVVNSFQVRLKASDDGGREMLRNLTRKAMEARCLVPAVPQHDVTEKVLWNASAHGYPPRLLESMFQGSVRLILTDLLASLAPWPEAFLDPPPPETGSLPKVAAQLRRFVDENLEHPTTLVEMASHFHYSPRHLNRIFNLHFGVPIGRYLRQRRLDLAADWLVDTDRPVKDIALSLGYRTLGQFCRYFHEHLGIAPTDYRIKRRKGFIGQLRSEAQWEKASSETIARVSRVAG